MIGFLAFGARCGFFGGVLRIVASIVPYTPETAWLEGYYALIDVCLLLGLIALFIVIVDRTGLGGKVGFVVALMGQASIIGPDCRMFGIDFYMVGSLVLLTGLGIWAVAMIRAWAMPAAAGCWLVSIGMALAALIWGGAAFIPLAGAALGGGFALAGRSTLIEATRRDIVPRSSPG